MKRQKVFQLGILKYCWGNNWSKNGIQREAYLYMHISIFHSLVCFCLELLCFFSNIEFQPFKVIGMFPYLCCVRKQCICFW